MTVLLLLIILALFILLLGLRSRTAQLEQQIQHLTTDTASTAQLNALRARVAALEQLRHPAHQPTPQPDQQTTPPPAIARPIHVPQNVPPHEPEAPRERAAPPPFVPDEPIPPPRSAPAPPFPAPPVEVPLSKSIRGIFGHEEWETLVGGSLLNKIGAVVLVIGIALFLGYSFAHITPPGRASIALLGSVAILGAGLWTERRPRFKVFARGLIGAGWAALYATSYAIYALPAARIISNPYIGSAVMLLVACAMIGHSLRYRAQAVTAIAYFAAFAAISVTPASPFALLSLVPLAASLLYLSDRFQWHAMALFGLVATYLTCFAKAASTDSLALTETTFVAQWLLFEAFDLLRMKRRVTGGGMEYLFPLNSMAFVALSYRAWAHSQPHLLWAASASGALLFLASAVARAFTRPPASFPSDTPLQERLRAGSYEGAFLVSAVLAGMAIVGRVPGVWTSFSLAVEAEIIYLAGLRLRSRFLRFAGVSAFAFSLGQLLTVAADRDQAPVFGHPLWTWTPGALLHAALFYFNRVIRRPNVVFSSAAAVLVAVALAGETPRDWIGTTWFLFGIALFLLGTCWPAVDFRLQSYPLLSLGVALTAVPQIGGHTSQWPPLAVTLVAAYLLSYSRRWLPMPSLPRNERNRLAIGIAAVVSLMSVLLLWRVVPDAYLALSWGLLTLLLFELGNRRLPPELRLSLLPMSLLTALATLFTQAAHFDEHPPFSVSLTYFCGWLFPWLAAARLTFWPVQRAAVWETQRVRDILLPIGTLAAMCWLWLLVPNTLVAAAWALLAVGLLALGSIPKLVTMPGASPARWLRLQSYIVAAFAFFAALANNIGPGLLQYSIPVVCLFYLAQWTAMKCNDKYIPLALSVLATTLLSVILYGEVSGEVLTVAWGLQGLALLGAGFPLRERSLRLQGLLLLLICILKLFLFDLRNLETVYRILSFVALGLILLAVSWIYTRFREQLKRII